MNIRAAVNRWICYICIGYSILLSGWFVLWATVGDSIWWLVLLNHIGYMWFVPLPVLVLVAIVAWQRIAALALIPAILSMAVVYAPVPIAEPIPAHAMVDLRVMTFNVLFSNQEPGAIAAVIQAAQPDVVALQEVQPAFWDALTSLLAARYPYTYRTHDHPYGTTALLSRYPFQRTQTIDLGADREAALGVIGVGSQQVTVLSAHLLAYGLSWVPLPKLPDLVALRVAEQNQQARYLIEAARQAPGDAVILACDCNSPETAMTARILMRYFTNVRRAIDWGMPATSRPTYMLQPFPNQIDYIFVHGHLTPRKRYFWSETGGSDHYPLLAELQAMR